MLTGITPSGAYSLRILQITDLHFGNHNEDLAETLKARVAEIKPDVIVATGDLVDSPRRTLFNQASDFLGVLGESCKQPNAGDPRIMAVPGNHDFLLTGIFRWPFRHTYFKSFGAVSTEHYFQEEKVWIFGFNSAQKRALATGEVLRQELVKFHNRYSELRKNDPAFETDAFKIVVVHHHPLPVNWQTDWQQRWLTMINSGTFLGAMLDRKINLILHGHEHLQGRARLESALGGGGKAETVVVSLGATLRKVVNPAQNWFNLITIEPPGKPTGRSVVVNSFAANQLQFHDSPDVYVVQSSEKGLVLDFEKRKVDAGFYYHQIASITDLNMDGDCRRVVENEDLEILDPHSKRAHEHDLELPHTSGDIDLFGVEVDKDSPCQGISIKEHETQSNMQTRAATINYSKSLGVNEKLSYRYHWWCLGAFAMNGSQFRYKYKDPSLLEFTHFHVMEPIKELTVVVKFPSGFAPAGHPQIRVTKMDDTKLDNRLWERASELEEQLAQKEALRYIESLGLAALRVSTPQPGYCYGIEWKVPEEGPPEIDPLTQDLHDRLVAASRIPSKRDLLSPILVGILAEIVRITREVLIPDWVDPLGVNLMVFDPDSHRLVVIAAAMVGDPPTPLDKSKVEFGYGTGIAGRVFKANECRLHIHVKMQKRTTPSYYRVLPGRPPNPVLLALPLRSPEKLKHVYGVLNLTSSDLTCPLSHALEPGNPISEKKLGTFQTALDLVVLKSLQSLAKQALI
jgi:3',5'-cyclic AMP phosphodiesterase CpdA